MENQPNNIREKIWTVAAKEANLQISNTHMEVCSVSLVTRKTSAHSPGRMAQVENISYEMSSSRNFYLCLGRLQDNFFSVGRHLSSSLEKFIVKNLSFLWVLWSSIFLWFFHFSWVLAHLSLTWFFSFGNTNHPILIVFGLKTSLTLTICF
jgi:hypothetical protein